MASVVVEEDEVEAVDEVHPEEEDLAVEVVAEVGGVRPLSKHYTFG